MINKAVWESVLAEAELEINRADFQSLFAGTKLRQGTNGETEIICRNAVEQKILKTKYSPFIEKALKEKTKQKIKIVYKTNSNAIKLNKKNIGPLFGPQNNLVGLDPLYTMENFAVSSSNQLAHAAAQAVVNSPGKAYNPLFLWGGVGVGKTHLMHAIGHKILKRDEGARIVFCMGEEFTNEIIEAIQNKKTAFFKRKYRKAQLLLLDDVQFIAGKIKVQEEFFHTFVSIKKEGGQVILTSDRPPREIPELEARLRSRFEAGLIADISPPNFELRTAIILIKAKQRGKSLPMDTARFLANNVDDARRLEGLLIRLLTESEINKTYPSVDLAKEILGKTGTKDAVRPLLGASEVLKVIALRFNLTLQDLKGKRRSRPIAVPRQIAMFILREDLNMSFQDVGFFLGGRDHTTIIHGVDKVKRSLLKDSGWSGEIEGIKKEVWGKTD